MFDCELQRMEKLFLRGEASREEMVALLSRKGEVPYALPFGCFPPEVPVEVCRTKFKGEAKWWYNQDTPSSLIRAGEYQELLDTDVSDNRGVYILLKVSDYLYVYFKYTYKYDKKKIHLPTSNGHRGDFRGLFLRSFYGFWAPRKQGLYGVKGKPTHFLTHLNGKSIFDRYPLVLHLEDPEIYRVPRNHFREGSSSEFSFDFYCSGDVYPFHLWWKEKGDRQSKLLRLFQASVRRVSRGEWETEAERVFLQKKSHQPKKVKSPGG